MLDLTKYSHRLYKLGTNNVQDIGETTSSFSVSPTGYGPDILTNKLPTVFARVICALFLFWPLKNRGA